MKPLATTITVSLVCGVLAHPGYSSNQAPSPGTVLPDTNNPSGIHTIACSRSGGKPLPEPQDLEPQSLIPGGEETNVWHEGSLPGTVLDSTQKSKCITRLDAATFVSRMTAVLEHMPSDLGDKVATANNITAENFEFFSNSIRSTLGYPLNQPVSQSKQESVKFMTEVSKPYVNVSTLDLIVDCNKISWHFDFGKVGSGKYPVRGFALLNLSPTRQMTRLSLEFDSLSYGLNTGIRAIYRNGTTMPI